MLRLSRSGTQSQTPVLRSHTASERSRHSLEGPEENHRVDCICVTGYRSIEEKKHVIWELLWSLSSWKILPAHYHRVKGLCGELKDNKVL
jgi:hypothetical protein